MTTNTKTVYLAVYDTLADWEYGFATAYINRQQWQKETGRYEVKTVGESTAPIRTITGISIVPDVALSDMQTSDAAMLILPGADLFDLQPDVLTDFTKRAGEFVDADIPVAAICGATAGLARAGLLNDRRHTSSALQYLEATGYGGAANYVDTDAVYDQGIVTAGTTDPVAFAREIFKVLDLYESDKIESWWKLYSTSDPAAFFAFVS